MLCQFKKACEKNTKPTTIFLYVAAHVPTDSKVECAPQCLDAPVLFFSPGAGARSNIEGRIQLYSSLWIVFVYFPGVFYLRISRVSKLTQSFFTG